MRRLRFVPLLALLALAAPSFAGDALSPYVAEYEVLRGGAVEGRATVSLASEGDGVWRLEEHTRGTQGLAALAGLRIEETSRFRKTASGLQCLRHDYRQSGLRKRERRIECGDAGIVSRDHRGEHRFAAESGVIDRQAVSLALAMDLAAGRRGELEYRVVDREQLEAQAYRVAGEDTVEVPAGRLRAVKVERIRADARRSTTTWFGVEQGWVPVRIVQGEADGAAFELRLVSLRR
ncbi:MAG TPA: DUF3108 domain-containing protein [Chiayiivirga sp.]|nr:DUF3108 domain-containing protein [Chiayiivirga sp.]